MSKIPVNDSIAQVNKLYITYRRAFLEQHEKGYITQNRTLTDYWVEQHLLKKRTIGIKLGSQGFTKFLTFDVDYRDNFPKAKEVTEELVAFLNSYYGIALKDIHTHFSGGKGYHVTLFFDKAIQDKALYPFYKEVITELKLKETEVEFRASTSYGVKLPLGIHQKTKSFMSYCKYDSATGLINQMTEKESYEYFLGIEQQSLTDFEEFVLDGVKEVNKKAPSFNTEEAEDFESVLSELNIDGKSIDEVKKEMSAVLKNNRLTYQSSRHRVTLYLSIFLKENGQPLKDTQKIISEVLLNTYRNPVTRLLMSSDTTEEFIVSEVERLTTLTYEKDYKLTTRRKDVYVSKEEILEVLSVKEYHLKKILFTMLIQSKRYAKENGEFYMAYSTMTSMGNTDNRTRLLQYINRLSDMKKVQIISRNQLDEIRTKIEGSVISKPNVYKVGLKSSEIESESEVLKIQTNKDLTLEQVTALLIDKKVTKKVIPRRQWESHFQVNYAS